jgi:hypothetical protein
MKKAILILLVTVGLFNNATNAFCQSAPDLTKLKIVMIRHGEKPLKGDNLNCQGVNRSLQLPAVIKAKFGIPDYVYAPALELGTSTKHSRMFQTVTPLVAKYNLTVNSSHAEKDSEEIAADFKTKTGTILMVWEHKAIAPIVKALGINIQNLNWPDDDFDSIWIITFPKGVPTRGFKTVRKLSVLIL